MIYRIKQRTYTKLIMAITVYEHLRDLKMFRFYITLKIYKFIVHFLMKLHTYTEKNAIKL